MLPPATAGGHGCRPGGGAEGPRASGRAPPGTFGVPFHRLHPRARGGNPKSSAAMDAMLRAMASEAVAAGEGALST